MKANELRIGNKVIAYGEEIEISASYFAVLVMYEAKNEHHPCNPIPITEEWLLKFGFVHDCATTDINFWIDMATHYLELRDFRDEWYPTYCQLPELANERTQRCGINAIKYIHQLQNLYFALTGQELTFKK